MNFDTQSTEIVFIIEKTLIVGIGIDNEARYAKTFDWRNYEHLKRLLEFSNTEVDFMTFKTWVEDITEKHGKTAIIPGMKPTGHY